MSHGIRDKTAIDKIQSFYPHSEVKPGRTIGAVDLDPDYIIDRDYHQDIAVVKTETLLNADSAIESAFEFRKHGYRPAIMTPIDMDKVDKAGTPENEVINKCSDSRIVLISNRGDVMLNA
jgi:hypothetical protein